ncbi:hypothetical protein KO561_11745 [Radiobacillus kanasensis]|uniref:hypothetical protein n=1 Tax=Radiobacillus kanasensis TaxID=2844358 RepID=UPI001E361837|nr:hypothetical protein [Radiobacillus kanasensis]UFT97881.1 hypothetical protein KO561_11745 [Radiobacillus kanasensis]
MRANRKETIAKEANDIYGVNFHRFMEVEGQLNGMEIAEEFGISLGEVKKLKEKLNRS